MVLGEVSVELDRHLGDIAQGPFVANSNMANIGTTGAAGHIFDPRHMTIREHALKPDNHVFDAAIEC